MYILIFGNVVDGLTFRGPFNTVQEATEYADPLVEEWTIAELTSPDINIFPADSASLCICGHDKDVHRQTVHGDWVCNQCICRHFRIIRTRGVDF